MQPPVEEAVLENNVEFGNLYKTLSTVLLNRDGSTKIEPSAKQRNAVRTELRGYRIKAAKHHLLAQAISRAVPPPATTKPPATLSTRGKAPARRDPSSDLLPEALLDLLLLLPPFLAHASPLPQASLALLLSSPPFSELPELLPALAPLVATTLQASAVQLARTANPNTNPSYIHRAIPGVPAHVAALCTAVADQKAALTTARLAAGTSLVGILGRHSAAVAGLVRALEAKHGAVARSLELRAGDVALAAERQGREAEVALWSARRDTYTPDARAALRNYAKHLRDSKLRVGESIRTLRAELAAYGAAAAAKGGDGEGRQAVGDRNKERTMREMARVYRDVNRQIEEARRDLDRLGMRT